MEAQILRYYLKIFSNIFLLLLFICIFYFVYSIHKNIYLENNFITINKGQKIESVLKNYIKDDSKINIFFIKLYYVIQNSTFDKYIHYGDFYLEKKTTIIELINTISKPSNILNKITIIEGWSENNFEIELTKYFKKSKKILYEEIIADTYFYEKNQDFQSFRLKLINIKNKYFNKFKNNEILKSYTIKEIITIGSLIEKEGFDNEDKRKISSVIFNRLNNNMKLQIDASVIFAITNGKYDLNRKLFLSDLKIDHPYNTYKYHGLPPNPISFVGRNTLDIIFENYKTDFLFYFFDNSLKRHIFSKNYNEHLKKLNEYRNKQ